MQQAGSLRKNKIDKPRLTKGKRESIKWIKSEMKGRDYSGHHRNTKDYTRVL